jgi:hypothetical protein
LRSRRNNLQLDPCASCRPDDASRLACMRDSCILWLESFKNRATNCYSLHYVMPHCVDSGYCCRLILFSSNACYICHHSKM